MEKTITKKICLSIKKLLDWIENNGWESYDPADFKGLPFFRSLLKTQNILRRLILFFPYLVSALIPVYFRRVLGVKPTISAGGMGFLAGGYIELFKILKDEKFLQKAREILDWLIENSLKDHGNYYCWGLPFDWQSVVYVKKNTPIGYTTAECVKPFIEYYKITKEKKYLDIVISACRWIYENLNKKCHSYGGVSFSYTPLDNAEVINSNAIIASVFLEVGQLANIEEFIETAGKIMHFVLKEQLPNGAWYYFSYNYKFCPSQIDHYHTAMILQSINKVITLERNSGRKEIYRRALIRGLNFYLNFLFTKEGIPKFYPNKVYPVDIASCAEAITLLSQLKMTENIFPAYLYSKAEAINKKLVIWTIDNMQMPNGAFIYQKYYFKRIHLYSIRWGQAFMLRALALAYLLYQDTQR